MTILTGFLFLFISANGQRILNLSTGEITDEYLISEPERNIEYLDDGYLITYIFSKAILREDPTYPNSYFWSYPHFMESEVIGSPAFPYQNNWLDIDNSIPTMEIVESNYVDFHYQLASALPPQIEGLSTDNSAIHNRLPIASYHGFMPKSVVAEIGVSHITGKSQVGYTVYPIQYDYERKIIRAYTRISYKVSFSKKFEDSVNNKALMLARKGVNGYAKRYLIITTNKYQSAIDKLVEMEKLLGYDVIVKSQQKWDDSNEVLNAVKSVYKDTDNNLYALLIVGDYCDVPAEIKPKTDGYPRHVTDLSYACMDSENPTFPNLLYGRLSVNTLEEAQIVVDKLYNYTFNPTTDKEFYKKGLHSTMFDGDSIPYGSIHVPRFAWTSEMIRDIMQDNIHKNINRVYHSSLKEAILSRTFENEELQDPSVWQGNADDIIQAINKGVFYVCYRGHGFPDGWDIPDFSSSILKKISNVYELPVIFSISCLTGKFDENCCFCEAALRQLGGAIGVIGASEESFSGINDLFIFGIFDAIWPNSGFEQFCKTVTIGEIVPADELGEIKKQAYIRTQKSYEKNHLRFLQYFKEVYHLFGDPCMRIYTDVPTDFEQAKVERLDNSIKVNLGNEQGRISFYNHKTGEVFCKEGYSAEYATNDPINTIVCVSGHNKRALVSDTKQVDTIMVDGIYYRLAEHEAAVIQAPANKLKYTGDIVIKDVIWSRGQRYVVTKIEGQPFANTSITSVRLPESIKRIPIESFAACKNLKSAYLPGLEELPVYTFDGSKNLETVYLPSLKSIPDYAFDWCSGLKNLTIPEWIDHIGNYAFRGCASLQSFNFPSALRTIGRSSFQGTSIEEIELPDNFSKIGPCAFQDCKHLKTILFNERLACIDSKAFDGCDSIWRIECHSSNPPACESNAFSRYSYRHAYLFVPTDDYDKYESAQAWKNFDGLDIQEYDFYQNGVFYRRENNCRVKVVPAGWYHENLYTGDIIIPYDLVYKGDSFTISGIDEYALSFSPYLTSVRFECPNHINIGKGAFSDCSNLRRVILPRNQRTIPQSAFADCEDLESVELPQMLDSIGDKAFYGVSIESMFLPESLKYIGKEAFSGSALRNVIIPSSVKHIEAAAFKSCRLLQKVSFPTTSLYSELPSSMFEQCPNLVDVVMPTNITKIGGAAFKGCLKLTNITVPPNVSSIGKDALAQCSSLKEIHSYAMYPIVEDATAFDGIDKESCIVRRRQGLNYYGLMEGWKEFKHIHDLSFDLRENGICYKFIAGKGLMVTYFDQSYNSYSGDVTIPSYVNYNGKSYPVKAIGPKAFYNSTGLTHVTIPSTVLEIGDSAFLRCSQLQNIILPKSVQSIGTRAFAYCTSLNGIQLPEDLTFIRQYAFHNCKNLDTIVFGNKLKEIEPFAFCNCGNKIQELSFPKNLEMIGDRAFYKCTSLHKISVYSNCTMKANTFAGCNSIKEVFSYCQVPQAIDCNAFFPNVLENAVLYVPTGCIDTYRSLQGWQKFSSIIETSSDACVDGIFYALKSTPSSKKVKVIGTPAGRAPYSGIVEIPEKIHFNGADYYVIEIGDSAFYHCAKLKSVVVPSTISSVGKKAFAQCGALSAIYCFKGIPNVTQCDTTALDSTYTCTLYVTKNARPLYKKAGWKGVVDIIALYDMLSIDGLIYAYDKINKTAILEKVVDAASFEGLTVEVPASIKPKGRTISYRVVGIGKDAFRGVNLAKVAIPESVTSIGMNAFRDCHSLKQIVLHPNGLSIADSAFYNCDKLNSIYCRTSYIPRVEKSTFNTSNVWLYVPRKTFISNTNNWNRDTWHIHYCNYDVYAQGVFCLVNENGLTATVSYEVLDGKSYYDDVVIPETITIKGTPYRVTDIGDSAFYDCSDIISVSIPQSVFYIGRSAFEACTTINNITIPYNVMSIGEYAFYGCSSLFWVNSYSVAPPVCGKEAFGGIAANCELLVPINSLPNYQLANVWKDFFKTTQSISSTPAAEMRSLTDESLSVGQEETSCIENLRENEVRCKVYSIGGHLVGNNFKRLIIKNGKKLLTR